jgi:hypothetical protein
MAPTVQRRTVSIASGVLGHGHGNGMTSVPELAKLRDNFGCIQCRCPSLDNNHIPLPAMIC